MSENSASKHNQVTQSSEDKLREAFRIQAKACSHLGSPFTGRIFNLIAERLTPDGDLAQTMINWPGDISGIGAAVALRLAGGLHALVLNNSCDALRSVYPPNHQDKDDDAIWSALDAAFSDHETFLLNFMKSPPQTNEVRRTNALLPGFMTISALTELPLVMSEVGASAGLNLHWDEFHYHLGEVEWGKPSSPVKLSPEWKGAKPIESAIEVLSREACDLMPVDISDADERLRLLSYLWPDQYERLARTRAAISIAEMHDHEIIQADTIEWLQGRLAEPREGATHTIYHTIMWQYMSDEDQAKGEAIIRDAGTRATNTAPLAWLRLEADGRNSAALSLTLWPNGETRELARADFHGRWVDWSGWE